VAAGPAPLRRVGGVEPPQADGPWTRTSATLSTASRRSASQSSSC
jgi:hypothetical protein